MVADTPSRAVPARLAALGPVPSPHAAASPQQARTTKCEERDMRLGRLAGCCERDPRWIGAGEETSKMARGGRGVKESAPSTGSSYLPVQPWKLKSTSGRDI